MAESIFQKGLKDRHDLNTVPVTQRGITRKFKFKTQTHTHSLAHSLISRSKRVGLIKVFYKVSGEKK